MNEKAKAELYFEYLDQILEGNEIPGEIEDEEVNQLLVTAKKVMEVDFSMKSKVRDHLRNQLIRIFMSQEKDNNGWAPDHLLRDEDELLDEELSMAVAGSSEAGRMGFCGSYSECPYNRCTPDCMFRKY